MFPRFPNHQPDILSINWQRLCDILPTTAPNIDLIITAIAAAVAVATTATAAFLRLCQGRSTCAKKKDVTGRRFIDVYIYIYSYIIIHTLSNIYIHIYRYTYYVHIKSSKSLAFFWDHPLRVHPFSAVETIQPSHQSLQRKCSTSTHVFFFNQDHKSHPTRSTSRWLLHPKNYPAISTSASLNEFTVVPRSPKASLSPCLWVNEHLQTKGLWFMIGFTTLLSCAWESPGSS